MSLFLISLALLIGGYFTYGLFVEKVIGTDPKRPTPATTMADGVDFVPLPTWKVFLIQFLNIAGVGPIFGAIMGVTYGPAAFIWIVVGCIFAGAVHDFVSGMVSVRSGGKSLPELVGTELGNKVKAVMAALTALLLMLVVAVFVITPSNLLASMTPAWANGTFWAVVIFLYYVLATLLPVDKLIGNLYPVFGFALLFMAAGIMGYMIVNGMDIPVGLADGLCNRSLGGDATPVFPMVCISIACGAISGFHATQSPMMARCLKSEKYGRPIFYGAMISEGIVALIWAAAAITFTGGYDGLNAYFTANGADAGMLVKDVCNSWLGTFGGILAVLGVIAAPITTGDTALRSLRLMIADWAAISQRSFVKRLSVALPVIAIILVIMQLDFSVLWRYFAWANQTLSIFTLWTCTVWLARRSKLYLITMIPAMFMTMLCTTYIFFAPTGTGLTGLPLGVSFSIGIVAMIVCTAVFARWRARLNPSMLNA
ncbi:MAG: carbon starvation protein A [Candidatus Amulumruptor caecigallinarius]|nr:carbon starvation protein A [Candidatus Amulumruptor caecigallinarius]MCM1396061.1 carbon starvation protein A [Candidatus Amulumruptor caecigallinarius]MCM1453060.1 carbon starvation protein A [bacterium]